MRDEVRIHLHSDPEVPGTRWWAESDSGFTGGADVLNDLVAVVLEWAEADGIEVSFALIMDESSSESKYAEPVIHSGAEIFAQPSASEGGPKGHFGQVPIAIPA